MLPVDVAVDIPPPNPGGARDVKTSVHKIVCHPQDFHSRFTGNRRLVALEFRRELLYLII